MVYIYACISFWFDSHHPDQFEGKYMIGLIVSILGILCILYGIYGIIYSLIRFINYQNLQKESGINIHDGMVVNPKSGFVENDRKIL